jgi:hypothetical protein
MSSHKMPDTKAGVPMDANADVVHWTQAQLDKIRAWLNEKWGADRACAQCGTFAWDISAEPAIVPLSNPSGNSLPGGGYPAIVVACANCGTIILLSSFLVGLLGWRRPEDG